MSEKVLAELFDEAGVDGRLHAVELTTGREIGHGADEPVVLASVFKIPVLLELFLQGAAGDIDVTEVVSVPVGDRTPGPYGISVMRDPISMSWRDLAWLMMGISDNAATDFICDRLDVERVNRRIRELGLSRTVLIGACRDLFASIAEDTGVEDLGKVDMTDAALIDGLRASDPLVTSRSTAREVTTLLSLIWSDQAGPPLACAEVRRILSLQVWPHRLSAGFPEDEALVSAKTGTLARWRNEAGVVAYPDGRAFAVSVFTCSRTTTRKNPKADAVIGSAARAAVNLLSEAAD